MTYECGEWTNFGDISPFHGQLWIKNAFADCDDDFAECVEIIGCFDLYGMAENSVLIRTGSIYMPIDDPDKVASALGVIGVTPSLATWIDKALAFHAYGGMDEGFSSGEIVKIGKGGEGATDESLEPNTVLHGNASIQRYICNNYLA